MKRFLANIAPILVMVIYGVGFPELWLRFAVPLGIGAALAFPFASIWLAINQPRVRPIVFLLGAIPAYVILKLLYLKVLLPLAQQLFTQEVLSRSAWNYPLQFANLEETSVVFAQATIAMTAAYGFYLTRVTVAISKKREGN